MCSCVVSHADGCRYWYSLQSFLSFYVTKNCNFITNVKCSIFNLQVITSCSICLEVEILKIRKLSTSLYLLTFPLYHSLDKLQLCYVHVKPMKDFSLRDGMFFVLAFLHHLCTFVYTCFGILLLNPFDRV